MKHLIYVSMAVAVMAFATACSSINASRLISAGQYAVTAMTISDQQVAQLSGDAVKVMDVTNRVSPSGSTYTQRLNRLTANIKSPEGLKLNFKVYETSDINAFATGDGSIRVYSGLMNVMEDNELMAIIGHELGHVMHHDVRTAMRNTYLAYAAREALASTGETVARLTDSQLGEIAVSFTQARFSQQQEFAADEFGFEFSTAAGYSPYSMSNALQKLVTISGGAQASLVQQWFSSHPDNAERARRMREKADNLGK